MAKLGKLEKLKSAIKRWPSFTKTTRTNTNNHHHDHNNNMVSEDGQVSSSPLHAVYVGKSRRKYLLRSETICHPVFQELIERSGGVYHQDDAINGGDDLMVIACEVVLFEHLLWMLQSGAASQLDSMQELAEFYYTC